MALTGRFELRRTWTGRIVLQVEEEVKNHWPYSRATFRRHWRYATVMDLASPELRTLVDLRRRPRFVPEPEMPVVQSPAIPVAIPANGYDTERVVTH